jgi:hypothetical protein
VARPGRSLHSPPHGRFIVCSHCERAELQRRNQNLTAALATAEERAEQLRLANAATNADERQREARALQKRLKLATSEVCAPSKAASGHRAGVTVSRQDGCNAGEPARK